MSTSPQVLATLKSTKHVVRVILRVVCNCDTHSITDAKLLPFEVQVLAGGKRGRYSFVDAFKTEAGALRGAADKFAALALQL